MPLFHIRTVYGEHQTLYHIVRQSRASSGAWEVVDTYTTYEAALDCKEDLETLAQLTEAR